MLRCRSRQPGSYGAGLSTYQFREYLAFNNSIIANNYAGGVEDDLCSLFLDITVIGSSNVIRSANIDLPPDTIRDDPRLAPLADNGGPTLTNALLSGSPAKDAGHDERIARYDQRGPGFLREVGAHADIGAYEAQTANILFASGFD